MDTFPYFFLPPQWLMLRLFIAPRAANVHFEDHLEGDQIVFDYRMRPGVVTKSNALALMRAVGIL